MQQQHSTRPQCLSAFELDKIHIDDTKLNELYNDWILAAKKNEDIDIVKRDLDFAQRVSNMHEYRSKSFAATANYLGFFNGDWENQLSAIYVKAASVATKALFEINHDIYLLQNK